MRRGSGGRYGGRGEGSSRNGGGGGSGGGGGRGPPARRTNYRVIVTGELEEHRATYFTIVF